MERNTQKGDATLTREKETEEPEKEISLKPVTTGNNMASMTQNRQKLLKRENGGGENSLLEIETKFQKLK